MPTDEQIDTFFRFVNGVAQPPASAGLPIRRESPQLLFTADALRMLASVGAEQLKAVEREPKPKLDTMHAELDKFHARIVEHSLPLFAAGPFPAVLGREILIVTQHTLARSCPDIFIPAPIDEQGRRLADSILEESQRLGFDEVLEAFAVPRSEPAGSR